MSPSESAQTGRSSEGPETNSVTPAPTPRKKRRWFRRMTYGLIGLVVLLLILVGLAPMILSTAAARGLVLARVNTMIRGTIAVEDWTLSWTGPLAVRGLTVTDPEQRSVIDVSDASLSVGVWQLLTGGLNFGTATIQGGRVRIPINADGSVAIGESFASPASEAKPAAASSAQFGEEALPEPRGRVVIKDVAVELVRSDGRRFEVSSVEGSLDVQTLSTLAGEVALTLRDGGKLTGVVDVRDLVRGGKFEPEGANGTLKLSTPNAVAVGPLAQFAAQRENLRGTAAVDVDVQFKGTTVEGTVTASVSGLLDESITGAGAQALDATLKGTVGYSGDAVTANLDVTSNTGTAHADARYVLSPAAPALDGEQLLAAVLGGASIELPDFDLKGEANIDLAAVERAVPGLIRVKEGQTLTGGTLEIADLEARGGAEPLVRGSVQLRDFASRGASGEIRIAPVALTFDTQLQAGAGLELKAAELRASFAQITASGAASDMDATFDADLTKLKQEVGQIIDFGEFELGGRINGTLNIARVDDEHIDVKLSAAGSQVRYAAGERRVELAALNVEQAGQLTMADNKPQRFASMQTLLRVPDHLEVGATGHYDFNTGGYSADIDATRVELGFLHNQLAGLGVSVLERYGGSLSVKASVVQAGADQSIDTSGTLLAHALTVDGQAITDRDATLTWTNAQLDPKTIALRVAAAKLESALANVAVEEVRYASAAKLTLSGSVDASANVAGVLGVVARVAQMEEPPELAGQLTFNTEVDAECDTLTVSGRGSVDQLVVGSGESAFKQDQASFEATAKVDQKAERIDVTQFKLTSAPLSASVSGSVDRYSGPMQLALRGRYDSNWDQLAKILHEFAPATAESIVFKGATGSEFQINGAANDPKARPPFRGLTSGLDVGWAEARLYGVQAGAAKLSPSLKDGQLTLPATSIAAAGGKINLRGVLDFQPAEPTLRIAGELALLEDVALNNKLAQDVLSWLNPVFLNILQIEGKAQLRTQDVVLPLGESLTRGGNGRGRLDLKTVRMKPSGLLSELVALGGLSTSEMQSVQFSAVDFTVRDGRIFYDNFAMVFPGEFDVKFRGSVGLDSTLDLVVSLPVRPALLEKLGVKGIPPQVAQKLEKSRVELPLAGTRSQPRLDYSKIDAKELLKGLISSPEAPQKAIADLLKELGGQKASEPKKDKP